MNVEAVLESVVLGCCVEWVSLIWSLGWVGMAGFSCIIEIRQFLLCFVRNSLEMQDLNLILMLKWCGWVVAVYYLRFRKIMVFFLVVLSMLFCCLKGPYLRNERNYTVGVLKQTGAGKDLLWESFSCKCLILIGQITRELWQFHWFP